MGDWVTLLQSTIHPKYSGRTGEITKVDSQNSFKIVLKGEMPLWESCTNVRKATPEEIDSVTKPKEIIEYAGLRIGDNLPRNIICDWGEVGINRYSKGWMQQRGMFVSDRYIKAFKELDGIVGFLVSGTADVYLKADGFKEFMDSYSRPINTQPIKTTSEQYDLSTTITRAVKNNDPSIIVRETGKSIDELCKLVDEELEEGCLQVILKDISHIDCDGLNCIECPLSEITRNLPKSSIIEWLKFSEYVNERYLDNKVSDLDIDNPVFKNPLIFEECIEEKPEFSLFPNFVSKIN